MRDTLPAHPRLYETAVVNLDSSLGAGTHWVCYRKLNRTVQYFDSFGNLKPPTELMRYFDNCEVYYNYRRVQNFDSVVCGHLCLKFLCSDVQS